MSSLDAVLRGRPWSRRRAQTTAIAQPRHPLHQLDPALGVVAQVALLLLVQAVRRIRRPEV